MVVDNAELSLPLYTRISDIKKKKIFNNGTKKCPADKFTLTCCPDKLADSISLASIVQSEEDHLYFQVTDMICIAKDYRNRWQFPFTFDDRQQYNQYEEDIIRHCMRLDSSVGPYDPNSVEISSPADILPGEIFIVKSNDLYR